MMANPAVSTVHNQPEIPDKLYFRIGDVSKLAQVKPFVLRFWETEFPQLGPKKSGTGHRLYRRKDVELVLEIKRLLYDERFTIEGARNFLTSKAAVKPQPVKGKKKVEVSSAPAIQQDLFGGISPSALDPIREELKALLHLLR
jgi:DNA-binding transcriptional MerR regulator